MASDSPLLTGDRRRHRRGPGQAFHGERSVCRITFSPSPALVIGVRRTLVEFFEQQIDPAAAGGLSQAVQDLMRDTIRPGVDQIARVSLDVFPGEGRGVLEVQTRFSAHDGDPDRLRHLVDRLGRSPGKFTYFLMGASARRTNGVRARGQVETTVESGRAGKSTVVTTTTIRLSLVQVGDASPATAVGAQILRLFGQGSSDRNNDSNAG